MPDKRKSERIKKGVKSEVYADEHVSFSSAVDLSKGGIFISTPEPLSNGSEVNMSIHMPGHGEVEIKGVVKWVRSEESDTEKAGMGIEFINVNNDLKKKLDELVK
ncbi:MAG TPA: PilZ domain-containing protein [Spirochaetota bacterium]|nr:PilZ domain-containing protein [Spirochaetota bacterium]HPS86639.1 PilZ domain-containing protein [Spirochaetota bacterium]